MAITSSPPIRWRRIDISGGDYDCVAQRDEKVRALRVVVPTSAVGANIVFREDNETADITMRVAAGQVEIIPGDFTHVRQAGTNTTLIIYGAV